MPLLLISWSFSSHSIISSWFSFDNRLLIFYSLHSSHHYEDFFRLMASLDYSLIMSNLPFIYLSLPNILCVCVCVSVTVSVSVSTSMSVCVYVCISICVFICLHLYLCLCLRLYLSPLVSMLRVCSCSRSPLFNYLQRSPLLSHSRGSPSGLFLFPKISSSMPPLTPR